MNRQRRSPSLSECHRQDGAVLFVALIVMVAMTLAGLAVMRMADTNVLIAGNMAFRKNALHSAEAGIEVARTWIQGKTSNELQVDGASYYSSWSNFDPRTHDWANQSTLAVDDDGAGNRIRYVVHRLCQAAGAATATPCVTVQSGAGASTKRGPHYGDYPLSGGIQPYFRITVRVEGPRGTVSYVQSILY